MSDEKPELDAGQIAVREFQQRRAEELNEEQSRLKKHRNRINRRFVETDWPIDAVTGDRAELDHEDVRAPLDFEPKELTREDIEAAENSEFTFGQVDEHKLAVRRAERERERDAKRQVIGEKWTEKLVEARVEEAFRVLSRISVGNLGPRMFGNGMPTPVREMSDMVAQAGNKSLRKVMKRLLRNEGPPTREEVIRMEDTLAWPLRYLRDQDPDLAMFLNLGGMWKAWRAPISKKCKEIGVHRQVFYRDRKAAVRAIVEGLMRDGRAPT